MNYLIFDSDIYYETKEGSGRISRQDIGMIFTGPDKDVSIAVIDTLQKQVAAPQKDAFNRDQLIAASFSPEYVTQSEQIGSNMFQVIAVERAKVAEIYKSFGFENVRRVVPYGVALREFLKTSGLLDSKKRIVFLDHLDPMVLLTVFHNDVFTSPRRLSLNNRIATEVTRSQENYRNLNKDANEIDFLIVTNAKEIRDRIVSGGLEADENIVLVENRYPALAGLKEGKFSMHYLLPEQFIRLRRQKEMKKRFLGLGIAAGIFSAVLVIFLAAFGINKSAGLSLRDLRLKEQSAALKLKQAYALKYKDIVRKRTKVNIADFFELFISAVPREYTIESIIAKKLPDGAFRFEAVLYVAESDLPSPEFNLPRLFRQARIEDILVKDNLGIRVTLDMIQTEGGEANVDFLRKTQPQSRQGG